MQQPQQAPPLPNTVQAIEIVPSYGGVGAEIRGHDLAANSCPTPN